MSEPYIAEIRMFGCAYAPRYWADCDGTFLTIADYTTLYSIIGDLYGGDGRGTMALPNLSGRAPMHAGKGPGLSLHRLSERSGFEFVSLSQAQLPPHTHHINVNTESASSDQGEGKVLAKGDTGRGMPASRAIKEYSDYGPSSATPMDFSVLMTSGGSSAHPNMQPYLTVRFCIALEGIYPARN